MITKGLFSSNKDDWETPKDLFEKLNEEFKFTLDPCCSNENKKCKKFYTKKENGLLKDWKGETVYVNPPYGKELPKWVKKCYEEWLFNNTKIVMLIPARTDTKYFHEFIYHKAKIRFIKGRLKFSNSKNSAPFPSMIVIYE